MHDIYINVTKTGCQRSPLLIGYQGENEVTRIIVDYSAWTEEFGAGSLALEVMRSGDEIPYLATLTIADGKAVWLVSNVDTGAEGVGAAGFVYTVGDQIKKSAVFRFFVGRDIGGDPGERPDPYEGVIAHIEQLVKEAEDNAAAAETAQTAAEAARDAAASSATDAAGSATTATQQAQAAANSATAAETAQTAAETAQTAAEAARDAAAYSATDAAGSATEAAEQAQAAATAKADAEGAQQAAETAQTAAEAAQTAAEAARDAAASSATDAAGSATDATEQAQAAATARAAAEAARQAAETAKGAAEAAQQAIEDLTVSAEEIETAGPTVEKQVDPQTGAVNLNFGFAKNQATTSTTIGPASIVTFDSSAADMPLKGLTVDIEPVQAGSGDPSPENVRPITGWTGCNVTKTGKNLVSKISDGRTNNSVTYTPNQNGGIQVSCSSTSHSKSYSATNALAKTFILNPGTYTLSASIHGTALSLYVSFLPTGRSGFVTRSTPSQVFTLAEKTEVYIAISVEANGTSDETIYPMLEFGSTASVYEPFGAVYSITFPASAGTVYGGTLTINDDGSGELVVDRLITTLTGNESWTLSAASASNARRFLTRVNWPSWRAGYVDVSSHFAPIPGAQQVSGVWGDFSATNDRYLKLFDGNSHFANANELAAWVQEQVVNNTPVQFVYSMNSNITYNLTAEQITTLLGTNNIWADTGDVTVTYGAYLETVKKHAERLGESILSAIAPLEATYTASRAYAVGEFLFVGTKFFKVISSIAEGGTITPGTNVEQTTVGAQLTAALSNVYFISQPESRTASVGTGVVFEVSVAGAAPLTYQWEYQIANSVDWGLTGAGSGYTTNRFTIEAINSRNGIKYRCKVTNRYGVSAFSNAATLTVTE